jgi:hypothetical protein
MIQNPLLHSSFTQWIQIYIIYQDVSGRQRTQ